MIETNHPKFCWSINRDEKIKECQLCYMLWYYSSHKGWFENSDQLSKVAYRWKKARSSDVFLMTSFLDKMYDYFYRVRTDEASFNKNIRNDLNIAFKSSKDNQEQWKKNPKQTVMIRELVGKTEYDPILIRNVGDKLDTFTKNFFAGKTVQEIHTNDVTLIDFRPTKRTSTCLILAELNNLKIIVSLQLLYRRKSDRKTLSIHYKNDKEHSSPVEVAIIASFLNKEYKIPLEDILIRDEFLHNGQFIEHTVNEQMIEDMYLYISNSVKKMGKFVESENLDENKALNLYIAKRNPFHNDHSVKTDCCHYCELIRRDLELDPQGLM